MNQYGYEWRIIYRRSGADTRRQTRRERVERSDQRHRDNVRTAEARERQMVLQERLEKMDEIRRFRFAEHRVQVQSEFQQRRGDVQFGPVDQLFQRKRYRRGERRSVRSESEREKMYLHILAR